MMKCAFKNCKQEHDLWIKPHEDSDVVPICNGCARTENEQYHLSYQNSRPPEEVEDYSLAYNPDTALAEQLIDITNEIEDALTNYEGDNEEQIEKVAKAKEKIADTISEF